MTFSPLVEVKLTETQIAIALCASDLGGGHIGIAYHSEQGPSVLHLAWHKKLDLIRIPEEPHDFCWISTTLDLPPLASKQVVAYIRVVESNMPTINYGTDFVASKGSFDASGTYCPPEGSLGLTCASFVLEVLRGASVDLIQSETWQPSEENKTWKAEVCTLLERYGVDQNHVDAVKNNTNGSRLRPYELAGSAMLPRDKWPTNFSLAQSLATTAENALTNFCPIACP